MGRDRESPCMEMRRRRASEQPSVRRPYIRDCLSLRKPILTPEDMVDISCRAQRVHRSDEMSSASPRNFGSHRELLIMPEGGRSARRRVDPRGPPRGDHRSSWLMCGVVPEPDAADVRLAPDSAQKQTSREVRFVPFPDSRTAANQPGEQHLRHVESDSQIGIYGISGLR